MKGVSVHDSLEAAEEDVDGDDYGEDEDAGGDVHVELDGEKFDAAKKSRGGIHRHKEEYHKSGAVWMKRES